MSMMMSSIMSVMVVDKSGLPAYHFGKEHEFHQA